MPELSITHLSPRSMSLLQIHGRKEDEPEVAVLLFGSAEKGYSPITGPRAYSISSNEWLLVDYPRDKIRRWLSTALGRMAVRVTDVSNDFASLRIEGRSADTIFGGVVVEPRKGLAHPGSYLHAKLGRTHVVLQYISANTFELYVDKTHVRQLKAWVNSQTQTPSPNRRRSLQ